MTLSSRLGALLHRLRVAPTLAPLARRDRNFVRSRLRQALQDYYEEREIARGWVPLPNGRLVYANVNDELVKPLLFHGYFAEETETSIFSTYIESGDVVFDIGANYGLFTLAAVGPSASVAAVHLFEPNPEVAKCLRVTRQHHPSLPLHLHEYALSDQDGEALFHVPTAAASGHGALDRHQWGVERGIFPADSGIPVTVRTVDAVCAEYNLPRLDCIKIDVEGQEAAVLRGMRRSLLQYRPRVVMCETSIASEACTTLRKHYSRAEAITGERALTPVDDLPGTFWGNIFFTEPRQSAVG